MNGQCRQANVIYGATVKTLDVLGEAVEDSAETYTGISYPVWKIRMYRHHTTFNNQPTGLRLPWLITSGTSNALTSVMKEDRMNVNIVLTMRLHGRYLQEPLVITPSQGCAGCA